MKCNNCGSERAVGSGGSSVPTTIICPDCGTVQTFQNTVTVENYSMGKKYLISYYFGDSPFSPHFIIEYGSSMKKAIDYVRNAIPNIVVFAISELDDSVSFEDFYGE